MGTLADTGGFNAHPSPNIEHLPGTKNITFQPLSWSGWSCFYVGARGPRRADLPLRQQPIDEAWRLVVPQQGGGSLPPRAPNLAPL